MFEFECCGQKDDIYRVLECEQKTSTGCKTQLHHPNEVHGMSMEKLRKTL